MDKLWPEYRFVALFQKIGILGEAETLILHHPCGSQELGADNRLRENWSYSRAQKVSPLILTLNLAV